ncbi:MAG: 30S ribosomal protein S4 [Flavobacteriales bacterium]|nr:30S ribosomal protein S4 [Flavobacteriales bacterium]MCZ2443364.1 30S ribosomal protein S4 [Flavobacteriales bacterium]
MARYTGPKSKIARKFREPIFGPDKYLQKKNYPPGMHGPSKRKRKMSEYAIQLQEKQKAKYTYGILERQFRKMFDKASRMRGITGELLLMLCESRLDNVVYRLGIAPTRAAARQLVTHKHISVNGELVNVPSYQLKTGDKVEVREKSKSLGVIRNSVSNAEVKFDWLSWDPTHLTGTFVMAPRREQIPENIQEHLIVELYSK